MHDLTTPNGALAYLQDTPYAASNIEVIPGGCSAFLYRITLQTPLTTGEKTIVMKHFEGYAAAITRRKISAERGRFEYGALVALANSGLFDYNSVIQAPSPIHYDPETHTVLMTDLGPLTSIAQVLEQRINDARSNCSDSELAMRAEFQLACKVGHLIGDFLGRFHDWAASAKQAELRADFLANVAAETFLVFHHLRMLQCASRFGPEPDRRRMNSVLAVVRPGNLLHGDVLTMGECFLTNIMASPSFDPNNMRLYILDWETIRPAPPELDIGLITGTTLSFSRKFSAHEEYPFMSALHQAYRQYRPLDPIRAAITTGMYTLGIAAGLPWSTSQGDEYARGIAASGFELLKFAYDRDERGVMESDVLKYLFS